MYFLKTDIDEFAKHRERLDNLAVRGELCFALSVHERLQNRIKKATAWADEWLRLEHDFSIDESVQLVHDGFAADERTLCDRWRKRVKYELLLYRSAGMADGAIAARLRARYRRISRDAADQDHFLTQYITALARAYDPHSRYFSASELANFRI